ncbi:right-handed parallel beta-helix repeat-containing protein [Methanobrevibacter arboriphilus]|uniref:right-handed parallel beta-helix repeat-containing protein n=2 Tax=Methanobrevibacter arboriphilus TaxID=39441 RepID=UPI001C81B7F5|nr:right-handed parallel beta-helix repeat-containing protein [Methanobrevibacter arboriphilus]
MFKNKFFVSFVLVLVFLFLFSLSSVSAASYDFNNGNTTEQFQNVISTDTDDLVISFDDGDYTGWSQLNISRNATIVGKNRGGAKFTTSSGGNLFNVTAINVTIVNLTISGYATAIMSNCSDLTISNNNINTSGVSINLSSSGSANPITGVVIKDNIIKSSLSTNYGAVSLFGKSADKNIFDVLFSDNNITGSYYGVYLDGSSSNGVVSSANLVFENNNITGTPYGVHLYASSSNNTNITCTGNNITGTSRGVSLYASSNNSQFTFTDNNVTGTSGFGVYLSASSSNNSYFTFTGNNITGTSGVSLPVSSSNNSYFTFTGNNIIALTAIFGVTLTASSSNNSYFTFTGNNITGTLNYSVSLNVDSSNNINITFDHNNITGGTHGVSLSYLFASTSNNTNITFDHNNITGGTYGVHMEAYNSKNSQFIFDHNNITGTSGDGVYMRASSNNTNITFDHNNITGGTRGVYLEASSSNNNIITFDHNNITGVNYGVRLEADSSNNSYFTFTDNNVTGTSSGGVYLRSPSNNNIITFDHNNITSTSFYGVHLGVSSSNNISFTDNNIKGGSRSVHLDVSSSNNISFTDNNIIRGGDHGVRVDASSNNNSISLTGNNIAVESSSAVYLNAKNNTNITFDHNNITGKTGVSLSVSSINNTNIIFDHNNITGTLYTAFTMNGFTSNNINITFNDNNMTSVTYGCYLAVYSSNNTQFTFTDNNVTGTSNVGVYLNAYGSNSSQFTLDHNNITSTSNNGVYLSTFIYSSNNSQFTFTDNNITGVSYGVNVYSNNGNISSVMFLNNTINATNGSGFYFNNSGANAINVTDFVIRGNNIFASVVGLNFSGLKTGSLVNVTVEYNRIIAPVGVNLNGYDNGSSFDYNWWGVNDITGKTLSIDTVNHFILRITNLTSLDNLQSGDNVSFAFLVLNTTLTNEGVENLPYFALNGTFNGNSYDTSRDDSFEDNFTVSSGTQVVAATLDNQYAILAFNTNSSVIVSDVSIGDTAVISGQLSNYTGDGYDLLNVTVDGNIQSVTINSTGGWSLNYTTNKTGNITVTVNYTESDTGNYTSFTNTTIFEVFKNSTNSTINVGNVQIGTNATITGQLEGYTGDGSDLLNVTVDGNTQSVTINSTGGWSLNYTTNKTGNITVTVNYTESDTGNYTSFTNTTIFEVFKNSINSTINVGNVQIGTNATITGQLDNFTGIDLVNVTVDGNTQSITVNVTGGWSITYVANRTGNITVTVNFNGNENYTGFSNSTSFEVFKNSTNSTIIVSDVQVGNTAVITGQLANFTGIGFVNVTVDGRLYNVVVDSIGGNWTVSHVTNHTGTHNVTVSYTELDGGNYTSFTNTSSFAVLKNSTNSTILVGNVQVGTDVSITGQLVGYVGDGSDLLNVTVDGNFYSDVNINSNGAWNLTYLTNRTGNITVTVNYSGNDNYTSFNNSTTFEVFKNSTNSTIIVGNVQVGSDAFISGQLVGYVGDGSDSLTVTVDGNIYSYVTINSTGGWNLTYLTNRTGNITVSVSYIGNDNYTGFTNTNSFNVNKLATNSTINIPGTVKFNQAVSISGVLTDQNDNPIADADLELIIGGESFNVATDSSGVWSLNYTTNKTGNITVTVNYSGNDNYTSFNNSTTFEVFKNSTNSTIIVGNVQVGSDAFISGQLVGYVGDGSDSLTVTVDGNIYSYVTINSTGGWNLTYLTNRTGNITVSVSYIGNDNYTGFTNTNSFNVNKLATNSTINIPGTVKFNQAVSISGVLTDQNDNPIADADLELIIGGESFNVATDSSGVWSLNYTPKRAGVFDLSLVYLGDDLYEGFVENKIFNVSKLATNSSINIPNNVKVGKAITVSGVLTSGGKPLANANVLVTIAGKTYKVTTNSDGVWKLSYTPKSWKFTMKVSFAGDNDYLGFNISKSFKVVGKAKVKIVKISKLVKVGKYRVFNLYSKIYTIKNLGSALGSKDYVKYFKNWYLEKLSKTSKAIKYQFKTKSRVLKVQIKNLGVGKQVKFKIIVTHRKRL